MKFALMVPFTANDWLYFMHDGVGNNVELFESYQEAQAYNLDVLKGAGYVKQYTMDPNLNLDEVQRAELVLQGICPVCCHPYDEHVLIQHYADCKYYPTITDDEQ